MGPTEDAARPADEHGAVYPLMHSQLGMRDGQLAEPDNPAYSTSMVVWFDGTTDTGAVRSAVARVCREMPAVNVVLGVAADGTWTQTVDLGIADDIAVRDFSSEPDPAAAFTSWLQEQAAIAFTLIGAPLLRHTVALVNGRVAYVAIAHHVLVDGYGATLFQRRLVQVYMAARTGQPIPERTFGTLRELIAAVRVPDADDLARWVDHLGAGPPVVSLSDDVARPAPAPIMRRCVVAGARRHGQVWTALMIAAIAGYVGRYSGVDEVVVGLPFSNRRNQAERRTPAMLMTVVPLRVQVRRDTSPMDIAQSVGGSVRALADQSPPRAETLREAIPAVWRSGRLHGPIANIVPFEVDVPDRNAPCTVELPNHGPVDDVSVLVTPIGDHDVRVELSMNPRVYSEADAVAHASRLQRWLQSCVDEPDRVLADLAFLTLDEERAHRRAAEQPGEIAPVTWDTAASPAALAAAAGIEEIAAGIEVLDDFDQPVAFGRRGRVRVLGAHAPITTDLLASLDSSGIWFRGYRGDLRVVNGRTVELGRLAHEVSGRDEVVTARVDPDPGVARLVVRLRADVDVDQARRHLAPMVPRGVRFRFDSV